MASSVAVKPGRSEQEAVGDVEEQVFREEQVRRRIADAAPKRPLKPSRSEDIPNNVAAAAFEADATIPECLKFQSLVQAPNQIVGKEYPGDVPEEYVETDYYKDLNAVDKALHHTTGSGFIQVESHRASGLSSLVGVPSLNMDSKTDSDYLAVATEEFVETEYYKDLIAVDKSMHHTTGSGFIQVESITGENGANYNCVSGGLVRTKSNCNPATNDWVPAEPLHGVVVASEKPHRSEA